MIKPFRLCQIAKFIYLLLLSVSAYSQNVGINNPTPDASAVLDLTSSSKGLLVPRVALTATNSSSPVSSPATGLLVYNTATGGAVPNAVAPGFYYWDGALWRGMVTSGNGWGTYGNSGTNYTTQFIGTSDNQPLTFRINNVNAGLLDNIKDNTNFGYQAGTNTTGNWNSCFGNYAGYSTTTGTYNVNLGFHSGFNSTTGLNNVFVGGYAAEINTVGQGNVAVGRSAMFSNLNGSYNTSVGYTALRQNSSGSNNTAIGDSSGWANLASNNTFIGNASGRSNTTGKGITFTGNNAGALNTTASNNSFYGDSSGYANNSGSGNTFFGKSSGAQNTFGSGNTYIGINSGKNGTGGSYNTISGQNAGLNNTASYCTFIGVAAGANNTYPNNCFIGDSAGYSNTGGFFNTALGHCALKNNVTGQYQVAIGWKALYSHITGYGNIAIGLRALEADSNGVDNVALGGASLSTNVSGAHNAALGNNALQDNITGSYNTAAGNTAMLTNQTGSENSAFGQSSGSSGASNNRCTFLGYDADNSTATAITNSIAIGYQARATASNQITLGNTTITSLRSNVTTITSLSDGRFKTNIRENVKGLEFIRLLRPVTYNLDIHKLNRFLHTDSIADEEAVVAREKMLETGFIAQEVELAAKSLNYDFNGVDTPQNENDTYGIRYASFVMPLVKAVKELDNENNRLAAENNELKNRLERVEKVLKELGSK